MSATITVSRAGLLSTLQDRGRFGLRHLGIPWSGCLVPAWQIMGNALVGNAEHSSIIECWEGGLELLAGDEPIRFSLLGHTSLKASLTQGSDTQPLKPFQSYTAAPGSTITLSSTGHWRMAIVAIAGISLASQLGSTSTYGKASLGGLNGSALQAGDKLTVAAAVKSQAELACEDPLNTAYHSANLRIIMGPQQQHFSAQGIHNLTTGNYVLGTDADRMGARLTGPVLEHRDEASRDIVSDAIVPGSIQVPGNGQPIVLLNDAHTAGGYPKIATVISTDLPLLGLQRPGSSFQFEVLSIDQAIQTKKQQIDWVKEALQSIRAVVATTLSNEVLLSNNLIDGVTDGSHLNDQ